MNLFARLGLVGGMLLSCAPTLAQTGDWGDLAIISSTLGNNPNRLCLGAPAHMRPGDVGCPTHAPYVTRGGLIGIGTSSPSQPLHIETGPTGGVGGLIVTDATSGGSIRIGDGTAGANQFAPLVLGVPVGFTRFMGTYAEISATEDVGNMPAMIFIARTAAPAMAPLANRPLFAWRNHATEAMRLASTGNLGIGTGSPMARLDVAGTISASSAIQVGTSTLTCSDGIPGAMRYNNGNLQYCNGVAWTTLGVGGGGGMEDRITSGTTSIIATQDRSVTISTAGMERMLIGENGNIGIGTATPVGKLDIAGGNVRLAGAQILITQPTPVNTLLIRNFTAGNAQIFTNHANAPLSLGANNNHTQMVLAGSGNVGIGTATPNQMLDVSGSANISGTLKVAGNGAEPCGPATYGTIRYNADAQAFQMCRP